MPQPGKKYYDIGILEISGTVAAIFRNEKNINLSLACKIKGSEDLDAAGKPIMQENGYPKESPLWVSCTAWEHTYIGNVNPAHKQLETIDKGDKIKVVGHLAQYTNKRTGKKELQLSCNNVSLVFKKGNYISSQHQEENWNQESVADEIPF